MKLGITSPSSQNLSIVKHRNFSIVPYLWASEPLPFHTGESSSEGQNILFVDISGAGRGMNVTSRGKCKAAKLNECAEWKKMQAAELWRHWWDFIIDQHRNMKMPRFDLGVGLGHMYANMFTVDRLRQGQTDSHRFKQTHPTQPDPDRLRQTQTHASDSDRLR